MLGELGLEQSVEALSGLLETVERLDQANAMVFAGVREVEGLGKIHVDDLVEVGLDEGVLHVQSLHFPIERSDQVENGADGLICSGRSVRSCIVATLDLRVAAGDESNLVLPETVYSLRDAKSVLRLDRANGRVVLLIGSEFTPRVARLNTGVFDLLAGQPLSAVGASKSVFDRFWKVDFDGRRVDDLRNLRVDLCVGDDVSRRARVKGKKRCEKFFAILGDRVDDGEDDELSAEFGVVVVEEIALSVEDGLRHRAKDGLRCFRDGVEQVVGQSWDARIGRSRCSVDLGKAERRGCDERFLRAKGRLARYVRGRAASWSGALFDVVDDALQLGGSVGPETSSFCG